MRYSDIKRLVDELFRQFLRTVDARLRKVEKRDVEIRMGKYDGEMPEQWGPAYLYDRSLQIYKVNVTSEGTDETYDITIGTENITETTEYPYFFTTPVRWLKGTGLTVTVNDSEDLDDFEIVLTARIV